MLLWDGLDHVKDRERFRKNTFAMLDLLERVETITSDLEVIAAALERRTRG